MPFKPNFFQRGLLEYKLKQAAKVKNLLTATINYTFKSFYENVYKSELHAHAPELMDAFFSSLNLPSLSDDQKSTLDGLTSEFYNEFQSILVDPVLNMLNDSFEKAVLPMSLREANISLILKKSKQHCNAY